MGPYFLGTMNYFAGGLVIGNLLFRAAPKPVKKSYVVTLVSKETFEHENLGVFTDSEAAWDFAHEIAQEYNRHEWFVKIEEFTLDSTDKEPTLSDVPDVDVYPCAIEWEN